MHDDDPTDMVHDQFAQVLFGDGPLARPVLGSVESIEAIGRGRDQRLLPAPLPPAGHGRRGRRQRRPRRRRAAGQKALRRRRVLGGRRRRRAARGCGASALPASGGVRVVHRDDRAGERRARHARDVAAPTTGGSRSACSTPRSAAACRRGCSRRSARSAAWPTRSTATTRSTPTPACSASTPAACPRKVDEVLGDLPRRARRRSPRRASPTRSSTAARASCAARSCSASRTPARG